MAAEPSGRGRTLVLVRHGRTAWNLEGRAQGHTDVGLDATGRREAEKMADRVASIAPALLVSSDLARARETAAFVEKATGLTAREDARLREFDLGERTGLTAAEYLARRGAGPADTADVEGWVDPGSRQQVAGAETPQQVAARVVPAFRDALSHLEAEESAVLVGHGAALRVGVVAFLGWPLECAMDLSTLPNGSSAVLAERPQGGFRLRSYGVRRPG